jgi:hypothetical protein
LYFSTDRTCPEGMTQDPFTRGCYRVFSIFRSQDVALDYCAQLHPGAHLVDFQTKEEVEFVNALMDEKCPACMYYEWTLSVFTFTPITYHKIIVFYFCISS